MLPRYDALIDQEIVNYHIVTPFSEVTFDISYAPAEDDVSMA